MPLVNLRKILIGIIPVSLAFVGSLNCIWIHDRLISLSIAAVCGGISGVLWAYLEEKFNNE